MTAKKLLTILALTAVTLQSTFITDAAAAAFATKQDGDGAHLLNGPLGVLFNADDAADAGRRRQLEGEIESVLCTYEVSWPGKDKNKDPSFTVPRSEEPVNIRKLFLDYFTMKGIEKATGVENTELCAITHIYDVESPFGKPTKKTLFSEDTHDANTPGTTIMNFRIGSDTEYGKYQKASLTVCGLEEILATDGVEEISLTKYGTNKFWISKDGFFEEMFTVANDGDGQSSKCVITQFKLTAEVPDNLEGEFPVVKITPKFNNYIFQELVVSVEKNHVDTIVYLEAITEGKKTATKTLKINVDTSTDNQSGKCVFSVTPFKNETPMEYKPSSGETEITKNLAK